MYLCFVMHCFNLLCFRQHRLPPATFQQVGFFNLMPRTIKPRNIPCTIPACTKTFSNRGGLKNHLKVHRIPRQRIPPPLRQTPVPDQAFANDNNPPSPMPGGSQAEDEPMNAADDRTSHKRGERVRYHPLINGTPFLPSNFAVFYSLLFLQAFLVIPRETFCRKERCRHPGIIHLLTIFPHSKTVPNLSLPTYSFERIKCQHPVSTSSYRSGLQHFRRTKTHRLLTRKLCTTQLIRSRLAMHRGIHFQFLSMARSQKVTKLHGSMHNMMSGTAIHVLCSITR